MELSYQFHFFALNRELVLNNCIGEVCKYKGAHGRGTHLIFQNQTQYCWKNL
jgi:hypothetical protein